VPGEEENKRGVVKNGNNPGREGSALRGEGNDKSLRKPHCVSAKMGGGVLLKNKEQTKLRKCDSKEITNTSDSVGCGMLFNTGNLDGVLW